ncbi:MAG: hypothetical protein J6E46_13515 [Faecalicoccus sp.]|nr:hypothetical protein [Faecalicoccus sp.]
MTKEEYIQFQCPIRYEPHPELRDLMCELDTYPDAWDFRKSGKIYKYYEAFAKISTIELYKARIEELMSNRLFWEAFGEKIRVFKLILDYNRFMKKNFQAGKNDE